MRHQNWNRFWEMPERQWQQMIDVNLTGVWRTFKATTPILIEQGRGGSMIAISSGVRSQRPCQPKRTIAAAKHRALRLVKAAQLSWARTGSGELRAPVGSGHSDGHDSFVGPLLAAHPSYAASFVQILTIHCHHNRRHPRAVLCWPATMSRRRDRHATGLLITARPSSSTGPPPGQCLVGSVLIAAASAGRTRCRDVGDHDICPYRRRDTVEAGRDLGGGTMAHRSRDELVR